MSGDREDCKEAIRKALERWIQETTGTEEEYPRVPGAEPDEELWDEDEEPWDEPYGDDLPVREWDEEDEPGGEWDPYVELWGDSEEYWSWPGSSEFLKEWAWEWDEGCWDELYSEE